MTFDEIQEAITHTIAEIKDVKKELFQTTDSRERRRLKRRLKELQYLQLWHIDQFKNLRSNE